MNISAYGAVFEQLRVNLYSNTMNFYAKADMLYQDYDWSTSDDSSKLNGDPDRNLFTSTEGNEVLYMINFLMKETGLTSKEDGEMIEKLIHDKLPIGKQSQVTAKRWLQEKLEAIPNERG